jgi:Protein of unknown function (DUF3370)
VFTHHLSRAGQPSELRSLFQGIIVHNPGPDPAAVEVLQGASYLTRPDALFGMLPAYQEDFVGNVYAGPGSRVMNDVLRGRRQGGLPLVLTIPPGQSRMLMSLPIPAGLVVPTSNGRSTLVRMRSSAPIYIADLAMFAPRNLDGTERAPTMDEWQALLNQGSLSGPRDLVPTPDSSSSSDRVIYGRVAGISKGSKWEAQLTDGPKSNDLTIPAKGRAFSYGISTLAHGTFGTGQIQSAPMLARYNDTAYRANGNYGVHYSLTLPLRNNTRQTQTVGILLETPLKQDRTKNELLFLVPPEPRIFFRGIVRLRYKDDEGVERTRFIHVVQRRGEQGEAMITLKMAPGENRPIGVDLLYPPDATPPQILTVTTFE